MTSIMIDGEEFHVLVDGDHSKTAVMLSNPLGTHLHLWDPQIPALLEHFRIVRYDSRGHGKTAANHGPYSIEQLGRDALSILDALGIEKCHWLGLSMGSVVGLWLLAHVDHRFGRAVLAGAAAHLPGPDIWNSRIHAAREHGMERAAAAAAERWFTKAFRENEPEKVERAMAMVRATPLHGYAAACAALRDADLREAIRGITNDVLVIAGRNDLSTPPGLAALVASSIRGAKLVTLDAPHMSSIENEAHFNKEVLDFLTAPESALAQAHPQARRKAGKAPAGKISAVKKAAPNRASRRQGTQKKFAAKKLTGKNAAAKKARVKAPASRQPAKKAAGKKVRKGSAKAARRPKR